MYEFKDIGVLFGKYPVRFPVEQKVSIIHGYNGTGKTKVLELLNDYYKKQGESVLYFPVDRIFNLSEEEVESIIVMSAMLNEKDIFSMLDIQLQPWDYEGKKGKYIDSGYLQIVNFVGTIMLAKKPSIVIIDNVERGLHPLIRKIFLRAILALKNTKKLIVSTYSPEIITNLEKYVIHIEQCVKLR